MNSTSPNKTFVVHIDPTDKDIGLIEKLEAHQRGILHRAFSIFIFRDHRHSTEVLIQKRASDKYHSGGLWTNTCCSHAEAHIPVEITAQKRLKEEFGFTCPLHHAGTFLYKADVGNSLIEHEIDHVYTAFCSPLKLHPNPEEIEDFQWIDIEKLEQWMKTKPHDFTAWFEKAFDIALKYIRTTKSSS